MLTGSHHINFRVADNTPGTQKLLLLVCVVAFTQLSPKRYLSLETIDTSSPHNSRGRRWNKFKGLGEREGGTVGTEHLLTPHQRRYQ
jgi:hypothetical protein